jgi:hypothetical protein
MIESTQTVEKKKGHLPALFFLIHFLRWQFNHFRFSQEQTEKNAKVSKGSEKECMAYGLWTSDFLVFPLIFSGFFLQILQIVTRGVQLHHSQENAEETERKGGKEGNFQDYIPVYVPRPLEPSLSLLFFCPLFYRFYTMT